MSNKPESSECQLTIVPEKDKANATIEIIPFGTTDKIRLSAAIVRQMIAQPTRTGKQPDDNQCIKFIMLCQARHLNPFEGDAFMLGYDTQSGPQFSLITAQQVFLKRAEASKGFNGMESGVIVTTAAELGTGIIEREGDLVMDDEKLIGGWAKVYRKDREKPFYRRLKLSTFNTGRSRWEKDPAGMIVKCAEADALRTAFPTHLGGLYIEEEAPPIDVGPTIKRASIPKLKDLSGEQSDEATSRGTFGGVEETDVAGQPKGNAHQATPAQEPQKKTKLTRKKKDSPSKAPLLKHSEMLNLISDVGRTPDDFMSVALKEEWITADETWPLSEEKLATFLEPDARELVIEALNELPR